MNNKGFAISALVYGLAIMGLLIVAILMKTVSSTRENQKLLSEMIEEELNNLGMTANAFVPIPGDVGQSFTAQDDGLYKIELWGAAGSNGSGGYGAYTSGIISLKAGDNLYFYVGNSTSNGGQETDVRVISNGGYAGHDSYETRIMVAGGGGKNVNSHAKGIVQSNTLTLVPPTAQNKGGDGYIPGASANEGGSSFISGFGGSQAIIRGTAQLDNPTYKYFSINGYNNSIYDYEMDESKGRKYYFIDGMIIPGVNNGAGKATIRKINGTAQEIKPKISINTNELSDVQVQQITICKSSGTFTTADKNAIKIYAIGDITGVTATSDNGGINFSQANTLSSGCIRNTLTAVGQGKTVDEIAVLNLDTASKYKIDLKLADKTVHSLSGIKANTSGEIRFSLYQPVGIIPKTGNYYIAPLASENMVLTANGTTAKKQLLSGNKDQIWEIKLVDGTDAYKIVEMSKYNAMTLDTQTIIADNSEVTCSEAYNSITRNDNQLFKILGNPDGSFQITPYKDTAGSYAMTSTDTGLKITNKNINDNNQKFKLIAIDYNK